jgi:peptide methionine sulfoxide reductase MsrB
MRISVTSFRMDRNPTGTRYCMNGVALRFTPDGSDKR